MITRYRTAGMICFWIADLMIIGLLGFYYITTEQLPRIPDELDTLGKQAGVNIYADDGTLIYTINRSIDHVALEDVAPAFLHGVIATEDADFYHHRGVSLKALAGALASNLTTWRKTRGGSTLTQQIVKNLFLTREKTYRRKVKEVLLAIQLEAMFKNTYGNAHKDRLLELYINGSFYGTNAYGIEDAARVYFDRSARDLSLLEAATLAGLPNAPTALSPSPGDTASIATATRRAHHVLNRMVAEGYLTSEAADAAKADTLRLSTHNRRRNRTPYFVETIKSEVARQWGRSVLSFGALDIHTTLNLAFQRAAEGAVTAGVADLDRRLGFPPYTDAPQDARSDYVQAALLCTDLSNGHVKAMVGGRDIFVSYYNRATDARRQPGSSFKPIAYLAAFGSGKVTPLSLFIDEPRAYSVNGRPWSPTNFRDSYLGLTTAAWALIRSANATSVQVVDRIGPQSVVDLAERLGVLSPLSAVPSIALGSSEVSVIDLVTAYGSIANYGLRLTPTFITRIVDRNTDAELFQHRPAPTPVVDPVHAYSVLRLLQNVVDRGTGSAVRRLGYTGAAAGKTGTTNDNTDAWFTGFTPDYVASVWIGFDTRKGNRRLVDRHTRQQITGGSGAAPIWTTFMTSVNPNPSGSFTAPAGVVEQVIDPFTGLDPALIDSPTVRPITIALPEGTRPSTAADVDSVVSMRETVQD